MKQSIFKIPKMDCPSEENLIRIALDEIEGVHALKFDLNARQLEVTHRDGCDANISLALNPLGLGATLVNSVNLGTDELEGIMSTTENDIASTAEAKVLRQLLAINGFMFIAELAVGIYAQSSGLIADSLDMFADAAVYGLSLYAVGKVILFKKRAARISGYLQIILSVGALAEVVRRLAFGSDPEEFYMIGVAAVALAANALCLLLLSKHREGEVHMKASWIFSTNDVVANLGVIIAGVFVWIFNSNLPDLIVGLVIAGVVLRGGVRILRMSKT